MRIPLEAESTSVHRVAAAKLRFSWMVTALSRYGDAGEQVAAKDPHSKRIEQSDLLVSRSLPCVTRL